MKPYAEAFYKSKAWTDCREAYARSVGGLCERCLRDGRFTAGEIVHHKTHITPENITDPRVTLSWDNLELVCRRAMQLNTQEGKSGTRLTKWVE